MAEHTAWKVSRSIDGDFLGIYPDTGKAEFPIAKMPDFVRDEVNVANAHLIVAGKASLASLGEFLEKAEAKLNECGDINNAPFGMDHEQSTAYLQGKSSALQWTLEMLAPATLSAGKSQ